MIRVVIDSGVFISSVHRQSLLAELALVLRRPKFAAYVDEPIVREFVERIRRHAAVVDDPVERPALTRDSKDHYLVALACAERVDAIVSGDRDIIDAGLADPAVWTPRESPDRPETNDHGVAKRSLARPTGAYDMDSAATSANRTAASRSSISTCAATRARAAPEGEHAELLPTRCLSQVVTVPGSASTADSSGATGAAPS